MTLEQKREFSACGPKDFKTLSDIPTWPEYYANLKTSKSKSAEKGTNISKYKVNEAFNKKLSLIRADITTLEVDAIVNAANQTLLGGGGVDGAIHAAAGKQLKKECATLGGCETGDAKITEGYKLPAKHVIHTVGPIGEIPDKLQSCYRASLNLVKENNLKSVAFPCISTGIYGYPVKAATDVALQTIREWLEKDKYADKIERIILCLFLKKDVEVYEQLLQRRQGMRLILHRLEGILAAKKNESPVKRVGTKGMKETSSDKKFEDAVNTSPPTKQPEDSPSAPKRKSPHSSE
ncbi:hypothetical protein C0Q70_13125 [Pomacea canaliculata]|uniref:Macro domain-containing protein n=1 Tax=Pomacea canaliculata TaxID=400727 RepID=A0A2T7NWC0_POMCA|nr:hypothetical protein C0Q70_13125 [Pomacea canaliculata]